MNSSAENPHENMTFSRNEREASKIASADSVTRFFRMNGRLAHPGYRELHALLMKDPAAMQSEYVSGELFQNRKSGAETQTRKIGISRAHTD